MGEEVGRRIAYLVSLGYLFEFGLSFLLVVWILVGVPSHGELMIGLLEVSIIGVLVDLEDLIVIHSHILASSSTLRFPLLLSYYLMVVVMVNGERFEMQRLDSREAKGRGGA